MKIGIMTFHRAWNYGAVLQVYALQQSIRSRGYDCEIVDYRNDYIENSYSLWPNAKASPKELVKETVNLPVRMKRKKVFNTFRNKYLNIGPVYTMQTIVQANAEYDGFVFGSDQVWNPDLTDADMNYLGAFVTQNHKRNAYAASFGEKQLSDEHAEAYRKELSRFNKVAVREKIGQKHFFELTHKTSQEVVDPVFLLSAEEWAKIGTKKEVPYPYIFVYQLQGNKTQTMRYAQHLAKQTGLRIVEFQAWAYIKKRNVKPVYAGDPCDFLNLIQNAECVITDSFHCTAFSVILEKKFWARVNPQKEVLQTRVGNLLWDLNLQERILPNDVTKWGFNSEIDFLQAKELLQDKIYQSQQYLDNVLSEVQAKQGQ